MSDQVANVALRALLQGHSSKPAEPAGWKVALNVAAVQQRLGLTHALAAPIDRLDNYASRAVLSADPRHLLHVEAELALRLGRDLDRPLDREALRDSIETYTPCLELVDYAHSRAGIKEMFEHRFFHFGIVLGASVARDGFSPLPADLPTAYGSDGQVHARLPGVVPADVVDALHGALERALEAGTKLRRGQLVLCGSYIEPIPLPAGTSVRVSYGDLGTLTIARAAAS